MYVVCIYIHTSKYAKFNEDNFVFENCTIHCGMELYTTMLTAILFFSETKFVAVLFV